MAYLPGTSDKLLPLVLPYMYWIIPFSVCGMMTIIGLFFIRLDGAPAVYGKLNFLLNNHTT
jgi:hypothetical protein